MQNSLASSKSVYLQNHSKDPVHWRSYSDEIFETAKRTNKPIFLSVGYSSCHWCNVMHDESFTDPEVAKVLNEKFVPVKVDKEEYPEVDQYLQMACHLISGSGGWPLNAFLTPDNKPFFVGTYFPANPNENVPSFKNLISEMGDLWNQRPEDLIENSAKIFEELEKGPILKEKIDYPGHFPHPSSILKAIKDFEDKEEGGYGESPKFPQFSFYEYAIEQILDGTIEEEEKKHILFSLERMFASGVNDLVRGGFHRYSTTKDWNIPHFEKMLYDQAGLMKVAAKASLVYPSPLIFDTLYNTLDYVEKELLSDDGYFFTSQSSDSEGEEGLYFTFTEEEFKSALEGFNENEVEEALNYFTLTQDGNFRNGLNVISLNKTNLQDLYSADHWPKIRSALKLLLKERQQRIPPATDTKGISGWNFMILSALTDVYQYCTIPAIKVRAGQLIQKTVDSVLRLFCFQDENERTRILQTTSLSEKSDIAENYIFFAEAMLRLYEVSGNENFKENFKNVMNFIEDNFEVDEQIKSTLDSSNMNIHLNISHADSGYKSPYATLVSLKRRSFFLREKSVDASKNEVLAQHALRNPLFHGEGLRALTYPDDVYRVIKMPRSWVDDDQFLEKIHFFLPRFIFSYHDDENGWEICSSKQCELKGGSLEDFFKALIPG